jgi:glycosyltransferase involved in cell wall biosynthesis
VIASVIIPAYNNQQEVNDSVLSIIAQKTEISYEIIVVDNGSQEPITINRFLKCPYISLLNEKKPGSYSARNHGAMHARGDILVFLDSGCTANPDWLAHGIRFLQNNPDTIMGGKVEVCDLRTHTMVSLYDCLTAFPQNMYIEDFHFSGAGNLFIGRQTFKRLGGFNSQFYSGGDRELGLRARKLGIPVKFCKSAIVCHQARSTFSQLFKKSKRIIAGLLQLKKNGYQDILNTSYQHILMRLLIPPVKRAGHLFVVARKEGYSFAERIQVLIVFYYAHYIWHCILLLYRSGILTSKPRE